MSGAGHDDETVDRGPTGAVTPPQGEAQAYVPGQILAGRFRVVTRLGRGGMGEVYRADDLKLGQPVALKFLDPRVAASTVAEVRAARGVSHPNVCRVFDVGEAAGRPFLSMEFVDGEDLGALLRRIGRFPRERALEISRQLCAGLAAIHDAGLVHRDLKPGNVMIDGRGRARITDFGIAVEAAPAAGASGAAGTGGAASGAAASSPWAGTPAYMSPEQLAGEPASVRSDIYALGLVIFELFSGKPAFDAPDLATIRKRKTTGDPPSLSSSLREADPIVEEALQRCLSADPHERPASARALAALLPGGDPLAAALAAGETPSPDVVAASGGIGALRPATAWGLLGAVLLYIIASTVISRDARTLGQHPPPKPIPVLVERAREVLAAAGHDAPRVDHLEQLGASDQALWVLSAGRPRPQLRDAGAYYQLNYRESPIQLWNPGQPGFVGFEAPPVDVGGMANVIVDGAGRLLAFGVVPDQALPEPQGRPAGPGPGGEPAAPEPPEPRGGPAAPEPDWSRVLALTGYDVAALRPVEPRFTPPFYADARRAWDVAGASPDPVRIEAAGLRGRPTYLVVVGPWSRLENLPLGKAAPRGGLVQRVFDVLIVLAMAGVGGVLATRNVRAGRGDPRGALRVGLVVAGLDLLQSAFAVNTLGRPGDLRTLAYYLFSAALARGALISIAYLAIEPFLRRTWPKLLVGWTRLLGGRVADPRLGRELLLGSLLGFGIHLIPLTSYSMGWTLEPPGPFADAVMALNSPAQVLVRSLERLMNAGTTCFGVLCLLAGVSSVVRRRVAAAALTLVPLALIVFVDNRAQDVDLAFAIGTGVTVSTLFGLALFRVGIVGVLAFAFALNWTLFVPLGEAWFRPQALLATLLAVAPAVYGAVTASRGALSRPA